MAIVETLDRDDPREIGPYRLLGRLGSGSFGIVYAAVERGSKDKFAAVKVAGPRFADIADFTARFRNEIELIGRVESDFVPKLVGAEAGGDPPWMATELIPGPSLEQIIGWCGHLPEEAVWHLGHGIATALTAIHGCSFAHRDLRPKNVLMVPDGPWVIDFNLAHRVDVDSSEPYEPRRGDYSYMPPEEVRRGLQAARIPADIFALGATLVFAATGHPPFDDKNPADVIDARPNLDGLPDGLRDLAGSCLLTSEGLRPPLSQLSEEFGWHTGGSSRNGFAAALPPEVMARLESYRSELARLFGGYGPPRLGWPLRSGPAATIAYPQVRIIGSSAADGPGATWAPGVTSAAPVRWTKRLGSWISGKAAADEDRLAVNCLDGTIVVLDTADGQVPPGWRAPTAHVGAALHAGPLLLARKDGRGTIYAGAADGLVYAIDLASGQERVMIEAAAAIEGPPVAAGGRLCALSADGSIHAADPYTGEQRLLFQMEEAATGAVSAVAGTILVADTGGRVYAVDASSGRQNWRAVTGGLVLSAALASETWLYVGGTDGLVREIGFADGIEHAADDVGAPVHVTPVRDGSLLYVASGDGVVHAYDIGDRGSGGLKEAWRISLGEEIAGLAAFNGRLFVAAGYRLLEVDRQTRNYHELLRLDGLIGSPPVISGRHCYITGLGGIIICLALSLSYSI